MQIQKGFNFAFVNFVFLSGRKSVTEYPNGTLVLKGKKSPQTQMGPWPKELICFCLR